MEIIERQTSIAWRSTIRVPISANYGCIMYSNPVPVSVHPRDKDRRPRILTASRARQKGDSNESSLTLSRDKRRGRVARNTTHSSVHSCPVSSFSGRPCTLRPSSLSCAAASTTSAIQLSFPILPGRTGLSLQRSFPLRSFFHLSLLPVCNPLPPLASPSSTPGVFCLIILSARAARRYTSPSARHSSLFSLPRFLHINIAALSERFIAGKVRAGRGDQPGDHPEEGGEPDRCRVSRIERSRAGVE